MIPVTKDRFYAVINPLNVIGYCHALGNQQYRTDLKLEGHLFAQMFTDHTVYPPDKTYYLKGG